MLIDFFQSTLYPFTMISALRYLRVLIKYSVLYHYSEWTLRHICDRYRPPKFGVASDWNKVLKL